MRFVSSREIRVNPRPVFEVLAEEEVVVTSRGKPIALLVGVGEDDFEETLGIVRRARAQATASKIRKDAARKGLDRMSPEEVDEEIRAARDERARR